MVKEATRKGVLRFNPAFRLLNVLDGMSKATLAPSDKMFVPTRPDKFRTGSYPFSKFPSSPMHPVIPV